MAKPSAHRQGQSLLASSAKSRTAHIHYELLANESSSILLLQTPSEEYTNLNEF